MGQHRSTCLGCKLGPGQIRIGNPPKIIELQNRGWYQPFLGPIKRDFHEINIETVISILIRLILVSKKKRSETLNTTLKSKPRLERVTTNYSRILKPMRLHAKSVTEIETKSRTGQNYLLVMLSYTIAGAKSGTGQNDVSILKLIRNLKQLSDKSTVQMNQSDSKEISHVFLCIRWAGTRHEMSKQVRKNISSLSPPPKFSHFIKVQFVTYLGRTLHKTERRAH